VFDNLKHGAKGMFLGTPDCNPPGAKNARVHALWVKLNINQNLMVVTICTHAWTAI